MPPAPSKDDKADGAAAGAAAPAHPAPTDALAAAAAARKERERKEREEKEKEGMSEEDRKLKESLELLVTVITEAAEKGKEVSARHTNRSTNHRRAIFCWHARMSIADDRMCMDVRHWQGDVHRRAQTRRSDRRRVCVVWNLGLCLMILRPCCVARAAVRPALCPLFVEGE